MISLGTLAGKCRLKNKIISEIFTIKDFDNRIVTFLPGQSFMPYPCSHFYFDIKFGDRLYSKENRPGSPLLF